MNADIALRHRLLACLGDPSRFKVVCELVASPLCVTELALRVGLSQSCTTRHLQALERVGIVVSRRSGRRVVFRVTDEPRIHGLISWAIPREREDVATGVLHHSGRDSRPDQTAPATARRPAAFKRQDLEDFLL